MVVLATVAVVVVIIVGLVFAPVRVLELKGVPLLGPEPLPTVLDPIDVRDSVEGNLFKPGLIVVDWRNELGARVTGSYCEPDVERRVCEWESRVVKL